MDYVNTRPVGMLWPKFSFSDFYVVAIGTAAKPHCVLKSNLLSNCSHTVLMLLLLPLLSLLEGVYPRSQLLQGGAAECWYLRRRSRVQMLLIMVQRIFG